MNLDDLLALAATRTPTAAERARTRQAARRIMRPSVPALRDGDAGDPLTEEGDEAVWVTRAAQFAKHGSITWQLASGHIRWSDELAITFGFAPGTVPLSRDFLLSVLHPDDRGTVVRQLDGVWHRRRPGAFTVRIHRKDRAVRWLRCLAQLLTCADTNEPTGLVVTAEDVTAAELARQDEERTALRRAAGPAGLPAEDPVTGLLTRTRLVDRVDAAARAGGGTLAVVAVESPVRTVAMTQADSDRLMSEIAGFLRQLLPATDACGVVGPGEFAVLRTGSMVDDTRALITRAVGALRERLAPAGTGPALQAWGGVVLFDDTHGAGGTELLLDARAAWRQSRLRDQEVTLLPGPMKVALRRRVNVAEIDEVLADDRLRLHAQPILDMALNQINRHEILLRVLGPTNRPESPCTLLDLAERADGVLAIDRWVIERSLSFIGAGPRSSNVEYQINLSGRSVSHPALLPIITSALERHDVEPGSVTFEITESAVIHNMTAAVRFADGLRELGCRLALDDFGTGYASLHLLKYLPIELVKIDGEFVADLPRSGFCRTVVPAIVRMCRELGIRTAAEYVQDQATLALLRDYGVDFAQGYLIGRPAEIPVAAAGSFARRAIG